MTDRTLIVLTALTIASIERTLAQDQFFFDGAIPVTHQGAPLGLAWAGGMNNVQISSIDLNGDGQKDLFFFDRTGNKVITFLNTGAGGADAYMVTRNYDNVYPFNELHDWVLLRDYDCDGKEDIFTYSLAGFSVFRNTSNGADLSFELINFRVNSNYVSTNGDPIYANLFITQVDLPGIADVDGDGDLDVITFGQLGSYVEFHKNLSLETYGHCDSLIFERRNKCWGYFAENAADNGITLDIDCPFNVPNPEFPQRPGEVAFIPEDDDRAHSGSSVLVLDLDSSGTMDLVLGDIAAQNLVALYNGGEVDSAFMIQVDDAFPVYDVPLQLPFFPAGFYTDIDHDGMRDLVVGSNSYSGSHNYRSVWYYRNVGSDEAPVFDHQQEDLFQSTMLEFGEGAYPVPFDHDGDGLMDLVVGDHGYFQSGDFLGKLALLKNVGTADAPAFELLDTDLAGLSTSGIGQSPYPAFGDLDGDGDMDMLIGDDQGRMHFYRNVSTGGPAQFQLEQPNILDASGGMLDVGQFAAPQLHDLDGDGLMDLIVGERNGNLNYYRNTGTSAVPVWTLTSEDLGGVSTVEWWNVTGHSTPFMYITNTGERRMILGSEAGWLYQYGGIDGNINGTWELMDTTFMDLYEGVRTSICLYDFTGDGELDMVIGNLRGGLSFWRSDDVATLNDHSSVSEAVPFMIRPNPASGYVEFLAENAENGTWSIMNNMGQEVTQLRSSGILTTLSLDGWSPGLYHVRFQGPNGIGHQHMVVTGDRY